MTTRLQKPPKDAPPDPGAPSGSREWFAHNRAMIAWHQSWADWHHAKADQARGVLRLLVPVIGVLIVARIVLALVVDWPR